MSASYGAVPLRCRAVAAALLAGSGHDAGLLVLRRAGPLAGGAWGIVTGSIEPDETAPQAIRREIREETGLEIGRLFTSGLTESFYFGPDNVIEMMPIFVALVPQRSDITLDPGSDAFRWCGRDEALGLLHFAGQRRAILDIWHDFVDRAPDHFREVI